MIFSLHKRSAYKRMSLGHTRLKLYKGSWLQRHPWQQQVQWNMNLIMMYAVTMMVLTDRTERKIYNRWTVVNTFGKQVWEPPIHQLTYSSMTPTELKFWNYSWPVLVKLFIFNQSVSNNVALKFYPFDVVALSVCTHIADSYHGGFITTKYISYSCKSIYPSISLYLSDQPRKIIFP